MHSLKFCFSEEESENGSKNTSDNEEVKEDSVRLNFIFN